MTTKITRENFILMHADSAERDGVEYHTSPSKGAHMQCTSADGEQCAFFEEDCKGVPCTADERRQWHGKGNVVWLEVKQ